MDGCRHTSKIDEYVTPGNIFLRDKGAVTNSFRPVCL